jgi:hypothetical protein
VSTLLLRNAEVLLCLDDDGREIPGGGLFARNGVIEAVGTSDQLPRSADRVIDLRGRVLMPGLINTHHHLYQNLTRLLPAAQDAALFGWLRALYPGVGATDTRGLSRIGADRPGRTAPVRLHHLRRPPVYFSERQPPRRHDRGGAGDGDPLSMRCAAA